MEPAELSAMLKRFYVEARNVEGKPYSRNTMKAIRSGLDRFLSGSPTGWDVEYDYNNISAVYKTMYENASKITLNAMYRK